MAYQALYRKFRPSDFDEVYGQEHVVTALKNQLISDRIGHAYVFSGTRGTGKTSIAKIFSKALNCENPMDGNPCGECESCRKIAEGSSMNVLEVDGASNNRVENVRELIEDVKYPPVEGKYKVYIIDEAHMVTTAAFNALLKTIEEPPGYAVFILATTEEKKIPITILSRCQRYNFHTITVDTITRRLMDLRDAEGISIEDKALRYIARLADGSLRDALSILDKTLAFYYGQDITYDMTLEMLGASDVEVSSALFRAICNCDVATAIRIVDDALIRGVEPVTFVSDFLWYMRNILLIKNGQDIEEVVDATTENRELIKQEKDLVDNGTLMRHISLLSEVLADIKYSALNRVSLEMGIIRMCKPQMDEDYTSVISRLEALERGVTINPIPRSAPRQTAALVTQALPAAQMPQEDVVAEPEEPPGFSPPWEDDFDNPPVMEEEVQAHRQDRTPPRTVGTQAEALGAMIEAETEPNVSYTGSGSGELEDRWEDIISLLRQPYKSATQKSIPRTTGENTAEILFKKKSPAQMFYSKDEGAALLSETIDKVMGRHIEVSLRFVEEEELKSNTPESTAPRTPVSSGADFFAHLEETGITIEIEEE